MDDNKKLEVAVELAGFPAREKTLFSSIFKVSEYRPFNYREWVPNENDIPACLLIDLDSDEGLIRRDLEAVRPERYPIISVGKAPSDKLKTVAHIKRPIRWAEILATLDTALNIPVASPVEPAKAEQMSDAENELELGQVDQWYDRNTPMTFKSEPAVLVVDPDPTGGNYIADRLSGTGYRVDHVPSVAEAVSLLALHRYNCVIHEVELPDKSGFELCTLLKRRQDRRRTASIILTGSRNPLDRVRAASAGCDAFLSKPIQPQALLRTLEKFLPDWRYTAN
ncbi:MAG: response regulator [Burkholderiales bacterium]|nr:response regulator [Burkholderiales bacterium]